MVRAMCGVQLIDINELYSTHCIRVLDVEVEGQRKKGRPMRIWKKQVEEESVKADLRREDALCRSKWSVDVS